MITDKQKCIAEQSVYKDLFISRPDEVVTLAKGMLGTLFITEGKDELMYCSASGCKPILRPMSDLTKTITHKGYNDNKPFIPLEEIARVVFECEAKMNDEGEITINICGDIDGANLRSVICAKETGIVHYIEDEYYTSDHYRVENVWVSNEDYIILSDLLHQWHFDTRGLIAKGEAIDVNTLDINPYSVDLNNYENKI